MYDIDRSNLLSIESIKLHLFDILLLDKLHNRIDARAQSLVLAKKHIKYSCGTKSSAYFKEQYGKIDIQLKQLEAKKNTVSEYIKSNYDLNIMHPRFQNPEACGIIFQFFASEQALNLNEAEDLYDFLCSGEENRPSFTELTNNTEELTEMAQNIEYFTRCTTENREEAEHFLCGNSMNGELIERNPNAVDINYKILELNTNVVNLFYGSNAPFPAPANTF